jgi:rfaE bifunctional protein nucleotidyltransferase chain/domain
MSSSKIIPFETAGKLLGELRRQGRKIVQSHGVFDLTLPGHILHLEEARALGDVLVVTLNGDKHVQKGPGRPYFNEQLRAATVAALSCVDYVVIVPFPGAVEAIREVQPHVYCKGKDYEGRDTSVEVELKQELDAVAGIGGKTSYAGSLTFSSTKVINQNFDHLPAAVKQFCLSLSLEFSGKSFREAVDSFGNIKVLIIGDTIFDRYSFVSVQGLTSKNRIISGRFLKEETQCGGALAVFRHVKQFTSQVKFLSLVGTEPWVQPILREHISPEQDLILRDEQFTTIIKQRFVEPITEGKEVAKLFAVNYIDRDPPPVQIQKQVEELIQAEIAKADVVLLTDFGHGLLQPQIRNLIQERAPFLALNCQTNSNNHGFNIISRQYHRADAFTLDEHELMLSSGRRHVDFAAELKALQNNLGARYAWLTRGPVQTIGLLENQPPCLCPPLEHEVVDAVGAGDAFFSVAALAAASKLPVGLATFLGQLAGAQAVKIVGNAYPISKETFLKTGFALLNM